MLDSIDKKLLDIMQQNFPMTSEPFSALGKQLGVGGEEVLQQVERLKEEGIIRYIGPVFDARSLGYQTTLAAMPVPRDRLAEAAQLINRHPGVSHNYAREHQFNLWFTLAVPHEVDVQEELERLNRLTGAEVVLNLPALRMFKLRAIFNLAGDGQPTSDAERDYTTSLATAPDLPLVDRAVIDELQQDLPLVERPFHQMSAKLKLEVSEFLDRCRVLHERGIMRRFGAAIRHNKVGLSANAMACWIAAPNIVESAGKMVAILPEVSHCYERRPTPLWPYNLFAMIHGQSKEACQEVADRVSRNAGLDKGLLLFTVKEFKKARVKYSV